MPGLLRGDSDIKVLILYVLARLPEPVSIETLSELCLIDDNISYFSLTHCLSELTGTENIVKKHNRYAITERGKRAVTTVENDVPYTVRVKAERGCAAYRELVERASSVTVAHEISRRGDYIVDLRLTEDGADIMRLCLRVPGEERALEFENQFRENAPYIFNDILKLLSKNDKYPQKQ